MKLKSITFSLIALAILASCSTSNNVVSNRSIQKRKYNDGFYVSFDKLFNKKANDTFKNETVAEDNDVAISSTDEQPKLGLIEEKSFESTPFELAESPRFDENSSTHLTEKTELAKPLTVVNEEKNITTKLENLYPLKTIKTKVKAIQQNSSSSSDSTLILLIILAFFLPWLSVGIFTGWDLMLTLITLLLWFLFWLPGVVFGILVLLGFI